MLTRDEGVVKYHFQPLDGRVEVAPSLGANDRENHCTTIVPVMPGCRWQL